jgi:hypothetical protein
VELVLSDAGRITAGIVVLSVVTIAFGGTFLLRVVGGGVPMTDFQKAYARAGHAHAGVLVTLGLVCLLLAEATGMTGLLGWLARTGVLIAAILMSAGFFAASAGAGRTEPSGAIVVLWAGVAMLGAGVVTLGIGLLTA